MRIAIVVSEFPALSETFILSHITSMLDQGAEVTILAHRPRAEATCHPEVAAYGLRDKTCYSGAPADRRGRLAAVPGRLAAAMLSGRARPALAALNASSWGRTALNLDLFLAATGPLPQPASFDIIHCHFGDCALRGAFLRKMSLLQGRLVATLHGADDIIGEGPLRRLFELGDLFLPISEFWAKALVDYGCPSEKLRVHHVGIDTGRFAFKPRRRATGAPLRLATVCRLAEKKGLAYAIQALARLRVRRPDLAFVFSIVGDGPLEASLRSLTADLGLSGSVEFLGPRAHEEVVRLLDDAHVFLHPSVTATNGEREGIPVSIMEAMASGLAVVSTRHSGIPELVEHGVSGLLAPERDAEGLADHLAALADSPDLLAQLGQEGRKAVEAGFDRRVLDRGLLEIYGSLLAPAASEPAGAPILKMVR